MVDMTTKESDIINSLQPKEIPTEPERKGFFTPWKIATVGVAVGIALTAGANAAVGKIFEGKILPGVSVGGVDIGGNTPEEATQKLEKAFSHMLDQGLTVRFENTSTQIPLTTHGATDPDLVYELISCNIAEQVNTALHLPTKAPLFHLLGYKIDITPQMDIAQTKIIEAITKALPNAEQPGTPTDFVVTFNNETITNIQVVEAVPGFTADFEHALSVITNDASDFSLQPLELTQKSEQAKVSKEEAEKNIPQVQQALTNAPYTLSFNAADGNEHVFTITARDLAIWLAPEKNNGVVSLILNPTDISALLTQMHSDIDVAAKDARFIIKDNKVTEFSPAQDGLKINDDDLIRAILTAISNNTSNQTISIPVDRTQPAVKNENTNTYGINEVLGVGISNFATSPKNRRANIAHGAEKLNGTLVPPGETLSLVERLKPFTIEDGYLPELVIKGDEIIPEIGGGLCQIGTTTFRAAMNSGLDIVERHNHSLVVSYYNDPSNGNPGTDATIYDPSPDLKIKNDTAHYIMLQTEYDNENNELRFTFWGTADGRKGSYTPPQVLSWTGYGEPIITETETLPPGKKNCQAPHPGATTTFDYNVTYADGTTAQDTFTSSYRSLPQICLVGKEQSSTPQPESPTPETTPEIIIE